MNCPCSGVYVCAYIVIFLPWPAKKIWVSLWFLFFVSSLLRFSSLLKGKKHSEHHQQHTTATDKQTNYRMFYIYQCPVHLQLQTCKFKTKSPWMISHSRLFGKQKQKRSWDSPSSDRLWNTQKNNNNNRNAKGI